MTGSDFQIKSDLAGVAAADVANMVIAYEPIWAIGTGKTATSDQAQEVCGAIRACVAEIYDQATADSVRIQYGGSVNAEMQQSCSQSGHRWWSGWRSIPES